MKLASKSDLWLTSVAQMNPGSDREVGADNVTVEAEYLAEIIRENQELKKMVGELLVERRLRELETRGY
jgi:hypothetical protein